MKSELFVKQYYPDAFVKEVLAESKNKESKGLFECYTSKGNFLCDAHTRCSAWKKASDLMGGESLELNTSYVSERMDKYEIPLLKKRAVNGRIAFIYFDGDFYIQWMPQFSIIDVFNDKGKYIKRLRYKFANKIELEKTLSIITRKGHAANSHFCNVCLDTGLHHRAEEEYGMNNHVICTCQMGKLERKFGGVKKNSEPFPELLLE